MVQPRQIKKMEFVYQLIQSRYTVFSPAWFPIWEVNKCHSFENGLIDQKHDYFLDKLVRWKSQLFCLVISSRVKIMGQKNQSPNSLFCQTSLFPQAKRILDNLANKSLRYLEHRKMFLSLQEDSIQNQLRKCNREAFVLPQSKCDELSQWLSDKNVPTSNLNVGKELLSNSTIGISFVGLLPSHVGRKIWRSLEQAGIWKWLVAVTRTKVFFNSNEQVAPAKLSGNILVIFTLLLGGLLLSSFCLIMEALHGFCWFWLKPRVISKVK